MPAIERGKQRLALGVGTGAAHRFAFVRRCATIDMQAILNGEILEVAEPGIDAAQRLVGRVGLGDTRIAGKSGPGGRVDDQLRQTVAATAIEAVSLRVFIDQAFQLLLVLVQTGSSHRRWQVAERHRCDAALCLCGLARVADDERVDDWQQAGDDFREATLA